MSSCHHWLHQLTCRSFSNTQLSFLFSPPRFFKGEHALVSLLTVIHLNQTFTLIVLKCCKGFQECILPNPIIPPLYKTWPLDLTLLIFPSCYFLTYLDGTRSPELLFLSVFKEEECHPIAWYLSLYVGACVEAGGQTSGNIPQETAHLILR